MQKRFIEQFFRMDERSWERHATGWSVWTRFATLPFLFLACWSHVWIGPWGAGAAISAIALWLWVNPRILPLPSRPDTWQAKATFGERVWLNRFQIPIPANHVKIALGLSALASAGFLTGLYGALTNSLWLTLVGGALTYGGKLLFLDRMVRLYHDMKDKDPIYGSWLRIPSNDNRKRRDAA